MGSFVPGAVEGAGRAGRSPAASCSSAARKADPPLIQPLAHPNGNKSEVFCYLSDLVSKPERPGQVAGPLRTAGAPPAI